MKKNKFISHITFAALIAFASLIFNNGCDDNNSLHQEYLDRGETIYTGKADSVFVYPGNERAKFTWQINADPRISRTIIEWSEGGTNQSKEVPVTRTSSGRMYLETTFEINEGVYTFRVYTMDNEASRSLAVERTAQIYGPRYISYLMNRRVSSFFYDADSLTINWASTESAEIVYTTVAYIDKAEATAQLRVENDATQTVVKNVKMNANFEVVTTFLPAGSLDELDAIPSVYTATEAED